MNILLTLASPPPLPLLLHIKLFILNPSSKRLAVCEDEKAFAPDFKYLGNILGVSDYGDC